MQDLEFWASAGALTLGVAILLLVSLWRGRTTAAPAALQDIQVYRDQLTEVDRDLARGTLGETEAQRLRTEIARRLLAADKTLTTDKPAASAGSGKTSLVVSTVLLVAAGLAALAVYRQTGTPWYRDMPLERRLAELDANLASRPSQADYLASAGRPIDTAAAAKIAADLAAESDPAALKAASETHYAAGDFRAAALAMQRYIEVMGDQATSYDHVSLAVALVAEADGYISPETEAALRAALKLDMGNEVALFLVGDLFMQGRRFDRAFEFWRPIAEFGNPEAPWVMAARERIETVAELAGIRYRLPDGAAAQDPAGPDMAAVAGMSPEEQQAMVEGMVAQLSERLASEGGTAAEWARLITSLGVLGRVEEAQAIYDEAKERFAGRTEDLATLTEAAGVAGVTP
ncbi:c-type cytochrome biogenesis protein CcmI [Rhodobacter sp. Har01]|uniref:c-type cytochrome biogenesis protein CcmI n=1 Tax=Rhodobacter sp. Har01 TaxID=2883999 RepID=UPI001D087EFA|nr:c-type cytochrome biogenesis protein CcmI [Rhodobacter sp. Har01]MCB6176952.1 c-type cytochrome biogenesis protein CcmI [Rhodobacter sp. Har01]